MKWDTEYSVLDPRFAGGQMRIRGWKRQEEQDGVAKGQGPNPQNLGDLDLLRAENQPLMTISR